MARYRSLGWMVLLPALAYSLRTFALRAGDGEDWRKLRRQFQELPVEARRLVGPLFWLHGDESRERLEEYI